MNLTCPAPSRRRIRLRSRWNRRVTVGSHGEDILDDPHDPRNRSFPARRVAVTDTSHQRRRNQKEKDENERDNREPPHGSWSVPGHLTS